MPPGVAKAQVLLKLRTCPPLTSLIVPRGCNNASSVYKKTEHSPWELQVEGRLVQVSVSDNDHVWGVNSHNRIFRRTMNGWQQVSGSLKCVSVGPAGVWGVNSHDDIFYRTGTYGDVDTDGIEVMEAKKQ